MLQIHECVSLKVYGLRADKEAFDLLDDDKYPVKNFRYRLFFFVQAGSFTSREAAMKASSALDSYGRSQIYQAVVNGQEYYRVRFPSADVASADALVSRLVAGGHDNVLIVVD